MSCVTAPVRDAAEEASTLGSEQANLSPRRRAILEAAITVLARQGNRGLTHRAVDREAGLPEGSSSAYYRTREALLGSVGDLVADRLAVEVAALGERLASCPGDVARAVSEVSALFFRWLDRPELLTARLELTVVATRDADLARRFTQWREELVRTVDRVIADADDAGATGAASAETLVAALDGVLIASLLRPPAERHSYVATSTEQLLTGLGPTNGRG